MSDIQDTGMDEAAEQDAGTNEVKQLRDAYKREQEKAKAGESAVRELAFMKAGVDPDSSPAARFFADHYDGELNPEAISESFNQLGIGSQPTPEPAPEPEPEVDPGVQADQALQDSVRSAVHEDPTYTPPDINDPDPYEKLKKDFNEGVDAGLSREDMQVQAVNTLFKAYVNGDPRVITSKEKTFAEVQALREAGIDVR